jgi:translation initiation factor 3 subunit I
LNTLDVKNAVRSCGFSFSGNLLMYSTDKTMGHPCEIHMFDVRDHTQMSKSLFVYKERGIPGQVVNM